ncbi:MAG: LysE family translocator [Alphaproteobacteria bacterium]|nr:LysE family translocator [Alphaproteobacteria bacterium]
MDSLLFFLKGIGAGFVVAAPMGPVAVMCVRKTMARGAVAGCTIGAGAALADTVFAVVAAFGIGYVADLLLANAFWFRLAGGLILLVLAAKTLLTSPAEPERRSAEGLLGDFLAAMAVTGTNPITLVAFGVVFTALGLFAAGQVLLWAGALVAGVFCGAMLWWGLLAAIAGLLRPAIGLHGLRWINRVSAVVIAACGALVLFGALAPDSGIARLFDLPFE